MATWLGVGAVDIDGTLLEHPGKPDYLDPVSLDAATPHWPTCLRIRTLIEAGYDVHFITGRSHAVRPVTLAQVRRFVHPSIRDDQIHTQDQFTSYDEMARWKATRLKAVGAEWFIGDHAADQAAALQAGVPFQFAQAFQDASLIPPWARKAPQAPPHEHGVQCNDGPCREGDLDDDGRDPREAKWLCEGCKGIIRFNEDKPMNCFAQGVMAGLLLANHRKKCQGNHYENGHTGGPSLEEAFLGALVGKSWRAIRQQAEAPGAIGLAELRCSWSEDSTHWKALLDGRPCPVCGRSP